MLILGIESSCDETAAAVVESSGVVLSNFVQSQVSHARYGGVVPELASRDHLRNSTYVVKSALAEANVSLQEIGAISVTHRPGLVGALLVGVQLAKSIAWAGKKPMVGVDHLMGHLLAVFLRQPEKARVQGQPDVGSAISLERAEMENGDRVPTFPFVALLVSGGHTALYRVDGPLPEQCRELGATRDDAAGEAFDKVAKLLGLGYPGGPIIDHLAKTGDATRYPLKAPMASLDHLEFSFSGLKTKVVQLAAREPDLARRDPSRVADLCASFQRAVTETLASKLVRAAELEQVSYVILGGGVSANRELRTRVQELAQKRGLLAVVPPLWACTDNAAMIAYAGAKLLETGRRDGWDLLATSQTALPRATRKGRGKR